MSLMIDEKKKELITEMLSLDFSEDNEEKIKGLIKQRLEFLDGKKLYKYRTCSDINFNTLRKNKIFMPLAERFEDELDVTVNIDFSKNGQEILTWMHKDRNCLLMQLFDYFFNMSGQKNIVTLEDLKAYSDNFFNKDGSPNPLFVDPFLNNVAEKNNLEPYSMTSPELRNLYVSIKKEIDSLIDIITSAIEHLRTDNRKNFLVYCITERPDNSFMWDNYADKSKGYCIEYSFDNFQKIHLKIIKSYQDFSLYHIKKKYRILI